MFIRILLFSCLILLFSSSRVESCSTFLLEKNTQLLLAKSYDWIVEEGLVIVNKRHIAKQSMSTEQPMRWVSKYGSIIFTQAGRELPMGGMNETGLTIELMWLDETSHPSSDSRSTLYDIQWIQFQLDTASTVADVLASNAFVRIDKNSKALVHFIVADSTGNSAIIEFLDGVMVAYQRNEMRVPVLTNNTYQQSLDFLKKHQHCGGHAPPKEGFDSLDRFARLSTLLHDFSLNKQEASVSSAFHILSSVANFQDFPKEEATFENMNCLMRTRWNIVYDITKKEIHFLTGSHQKIRTIHLSAFDFSGNTPVQVFDLQNTTEGDVSNQFIPYTYQLNRDLIYRYYNQVPFLRDISNEIRELTALYPERTYYVGQD